MSATSNKQTGTASVRWLSAAECLEEVTKGVGAGWRGLPLHGATRDGLAPAKEAIGKNPERYKPVEPGTVFYNPMRILLGSIALLDDGEPRGITSPDYVVLRGRPGVLHPRVFYHWLRSHDGEQLIRELARGGVRERILFNRLNEGHIPVLPWSVQERLAEQLAILPYARTAIQARLAAAEALSAAYLREVFEGGQAEAWDSQLLGEICQGPGQYGTSQRSNAKQDGLPVLGMSHIHERRIRWRNLSYVQLPQDEENKYRLSAGDLLFNRTNSAELVGKTAVFDGSRPAVFASYLVRFRVRDDVANPHFVSAFINSRLGRAFVARHMGRAAGQVNISASTMARMDVPCPSLAVQNQIVTKLEASFAEADQLAAAIREELAAIDALPAALLREAFGSTPE